MRQSVRRELIRLLEITSIFSFEYMTFMALRQYLFADDGGVLMFAAGIAAAYAGYALSRLIAGNRKRLIFGLAAYSTILIPASLYVLISVSLSKSVWLILFEAPAVLIFYITGIRASQSKQDYFLSSHKIGAGMIFAVISLLSSYTLTSLSGIRAYELLLGLFFMTTGMIVKNREQLEDHLKMDGEISSDSKNIRRYNTWHIIALFAIIMLLFNLKGIMIFIVGIAGKVILFIFRAMHHIITLFGKKGTEGGSQDPFGGLGQEAPTDMSGGNSIIGLILTILFIALMIYLSIKLIPAIFAEIKESVISFINLIKRILAPGEARKPFNEYYVDVVEIIVPSEKAQRKKAVLKGATLLQNRLRRLKKSADPVERLRLMYGAILCILAGKGADIAPHDTTAEIYGKAVHAYASNAYSHEAYAHDAYSNDTSPGGATADKTSFADDLKHLTIAYERARYADHIPDSEEAALATKRYSNITSLLSANRKSKSR